MFHSPYNLEERTIQFSADVIDFCRGITINPVTKPLVSQLVRSATSIGANYAEANNAASRTDFRNKIFIAKKEAAETKYWLILIERFIEYKQQSDKLRRECQYILMTLQKIVSTMRDNAVNGKWLKHGERLTVKGKRN